MSSPLSTVPSVTTRIKPARTVEKLVTASTTARTKRTTPPASSAEFVAMQATWLATVLTAFVAKTGATMTVAALAVLAVDLLLAVLAEVMLPTRSTKL